MSAFTALNGTSPKAAEAPTAAVARGPRAAPSSSERPQSASTHQHQPTSEAAIPRRESWPTQGQDPAAAPAASHSLSESEASHKRKRSESVEAARGDVRDKTPEKGPDQPRSQNPDAYETPHREYRRYSDEQRDGEKEGWYTHQARDDRHHYDSQASVNSPHGPSQTDDQSANAHHHATESEYYNGSGSPDGDDGDRSMSLYHSSYGEHRPDSMLQHDPKKRKRNFSNRTKTGCLTCRKRKKKCDEQKPECKLYCVSPHSPPSTRD